VKRLLLVHSTSFSGISCLARSMKFWPPVRLHIHRVVADRLQFSLALGAAHIRNSHKGTGSKGRISILSRPFAAIVAKGSLRLEQKDRTADVITVDE
jgi:hypothetical protein